MLFMQQFHLNHKQNYIHNSTRVQMIRNLETVTLQHKKQAQVIYKN